MNPSQHTDRDTESSAVDACTLLAGCSSGAGSQDNSNDSKGKSVASTAVDAAAVASAAGDWFRGQPSSNAEDAEIAGWFRGQPTCAPNWFTGQPMNTAVDIAAGDWFRGQPSSSATNTEIAGWFRGKPAGTGKWFTGQPMNTADKGVKSFVTKVTTVGIGVLVLLHRTLASEYSGCRSTCPTHASPSRSPICAHHFSCCTFGSTKMHSNTCLVPVLTSWVVLHLACVSYPGLV